MSRAALGCAAAIVLLASAPKESRAQTRRTVTVAPFSVVGSETTKKAVRKLVALVTDEVARLPGFEMIALPAQIARSRPELATCEGEAGCLAEIGQAASASQVIYGEVGGLGAAQVLYLKVIDAAKVKTLRSTLLELGDQPPSRDAVRAAVTRLLSPQSYVGELKVNADVSGAAVYIDGVRQRVEPGTAIKLRVGSHAVRITHPEFRDFVRFVDIEYDKTLELDANLQQYPVISSAMSFDAPTERPRSDSTPWYGRWYTIVGVGAVVFTTATVVMALRNRGVDADRREQVDVPQPALLRF